MLAAHRDQENLLSHQAAAASSKQQLQSKTPGARYPKTPLKVPLNDENTNHGFGGKSVLRTKGNNENIATVGKGGNGLGKATRSNLMTPAEPRTTRAPLGNKTTNAKARATQQNAGVKDIVREFEKTGIKPTTTVRPRQGGPQVESSKLEVHTDKSPLDEDEDIEYAPPSVKDAPYQSDVFPDGVLTYAGLKPENMFKGYYQYYFNHVDDNGMSATEREMEEQRKRDFQRGDEQIRKDMDEFDWSIGDVPASKDFFKVQKDSVTAAEEATQDKKPRALALRAPTTVASRRAALALAMPAKPLSTSQTKANRPLGAAAAPATKPKPKPFLLAGRKTALPAIQPRSTSTPVDRAGSVAASRSTLGYSKGRSASSTVHTRMPSVSRLPEVASPNQPRPRALTRSVSTASSGSDCTITPARFAQTSKDWKQPEFMSIFDDVDEEGDGNPASMPSFDYVDDDDFQLSTNF
ncbi:hypothetical protein B0H63DRAFT_480245 [Podospora didyma]|uniref:Uncharacterized protein n=1 Tax=Podospora didyma TaxID=330526 RepID=A0AAE0KLA8_9PEZI|nr:hypothetical protein B0H63DRAFT_480245 [Podospora didyma]